VVRQQQVAPLHSTSAQRERGKGVRRGERSGHTEAGKGVRREEGSGGR
jgi:hypothetical protein